MQEPIRQGVVFNYYVKDVADSAKASVTIFDKNHKLIKTFSTDAKENNDKIEVSARHEPVCMESAISRSGTD